MLQGHGCPKCANNYKWTSKEFKEKMSNIAPNIELITNYEKSHKKIKCKCKIDGHEWEATASSLLHQKTGCPICCQSKGEKEISSWLNKHGFNFEIQKSFKGLIGIGGGLLSYDFYIPSLNILIEYQGSQHEKVINYFGGIESLKRQQEHDYRKREYAKENGINLVEIWYQDFNLISNILESKLILGKRMIN